MLAPGPDISLSTAASLTGLDLPGVRQLLRQLSDAHMVDESVPDRYRMHDLVRLYATDRAEALTLPDDRRLAVRRVLDHYLHSAYAADRLLDPHRDPIVLDDPASGAHPDELADHAAALTWFAAEHATLRAAVNRAAGAGFDTHTWSLAWAVVTYLDRRGHWHDQVSTQRAALDAARRLDNRLAQARAHTQRSRSR